MQDRDPPTSGPSPGQPPPARPAPPPPSPSAGRDASWGEPGYQGPLDPDRQGRLAVAWVVGIVGALVLAAAALGGFGILFSMGQRHAAPVSGAGAPLPAAAPQPTIAPSPPAQDPTAPTTGPGSEPPSSGDGGPSRSSNAFYSIKIPEGFQDVTDSYRSEHPDERDTAQALAGQPGSPPTPESSIVISRRPEGSAAGRSLDGLAADRVRALRRAGASGAGAARHSSIGPDPAVEVELTLQAGGQALHRIQVLCVHGGRVWEIAVTSPAGSQGFAAQAWTTVKTGWQWR